MVASSWATSAATRRSMLGNRSRDTAPELALRSALHARGFRYRVDARPIAEFRRRADIVFTRLRVAVFVDGCFWHGCPLHYRVPTLNADYWRPKIQRNRVRDLETTECLSAAGWTVLRFWTHEPTAQMLAETMRAVNQQRARLGLAAIPAAAAALRSVPTNGMSGGATNLE